MAEEQRSCNNDLSLCYAFVYYLFSLRMCRYVMDTVFVIQEAAGWQAWIPLYAKDVKYASRGCSKDQETISIDITR